MSSSDDQAGPSRDAEEDMTPSRVRANRVSQRLMKIEEYAYDNNNELGTLVCSMARVVESFFKCASLQERAQKLYDLAAARETLSDEALEDQHFNVLVDFSAALSGTMEVLMERETRMPKMKTAEPTAVVSKQQIKEKPLLTKRAPTAPAPKEKPLAKRGRPPMKASPVVEAQQAPPAKKPVPQKNYGNQSIAWTPIERTNRRRQIQEMASSNSHLDEIGRVLLDATDDGSLSPAALREPKEEEEEERERAAMEEDAVRGNWKPEEAAIKKEEPEEEEEYGEGQLFYPSTRGGPRPGTILGKRRM